MSRMSQHTTTEPVLIHDMCLALAHRWEPERKFMILTAYLDESGTHGGDVALMAGYLAEARQWRKFERRAGKLFKRFNVDIFHMIDVKRTDKDFEGWAVDKKIEFLDEFQHIVNECLELGVISVLSYADYEYYKNMDWPKGTQKDSIYGILFRASLSTILKLLPDVKRWDTRIPPRLNIVLEGGNTNSEDAVRLYNLFQKKFSDVAPEIFAGLTFATKHRNLPIAAADMIAYSAYHHETQAKPIGHSKTPRKAGKSYRGNCYRKVIDRPGLDKLFNQAIEIASETALARKMRKKEQSS